MKTYSISRLGRACGLSRSTLLYYDRLGLLKPAGRTGSGYRYYTEAEQRRLERVGRFREAGLTLKEIRAVLSSGGRPGARLLEKRLRETAEKMASLKNQQRLLAGMLSQVACGKRPPMVDVKLWVEMLRAAGMDQDGMHRWHSEFERRAPEGHGEFLLSLGIPPHQVEEIRRLSRGEWQMFIEAPSVVLRRFRPEDTEKFFRMGQEKEMRTWLPSHAFRDQAHAASVLEYVIKQYDTGADPRSVPVVFAVQLKTTGELIGHAGLTPSEEAVEVTFAIERAQQGKGLAAEAVKTLCAWATRVYPISRILGTTAKRNIAAQRVLEKAGFATKKPPGMPSAGTKQTVVIFEWNGVGQVSVSDNVLFSFTVPSGGGWLNRAVCSFRAFATNPVRNSSEDCHNPCRRGLSTLRSCLGSAFVNP